MAIGECKAIGCHVCAPPVSLCVPGTTCRLSQRLLLRPNDDFSPLPAQLLRKYIAYARQYVSPRLTDEALQVCDLCEKLAGMYAARRTECFTQISVLRTRRAT